MSAVRTVTYAEANGGIWSMTCAECPLLPHTRALGHPDPQCVGGIATNMQGPVILKSCSHRAGDSFANDANGGTTLVCNHGDKS